MNASQAQSDPLAAFPIVISLPVQWGDQDSMGHVNNVVFFRWCESARIEYFGRVGMPGRRAGGQGEFILASIRCDFRRQVNFPDTVRIGARISRIGRSSMTMDHVVVSQAQQAVVAEAESTMVSFDYGSGTSQPVPAEARAAIAKLEGREM
jgi:acyl-CoA thioester hydrolase